MTNEEAHRIIMVDADFDFSKISPKSQQTADALCLAVKALEKQIPKKPKVNHYEEEGEKPYTKICCPNGCCIQLFPVTEKQLAHEHSYCPKCGQKIDWEER